MPGLTTFWIAIDRMVWKWMQILSFYAEHLVRDFTWTIFHVVYMVQLGIKPTNIVSWCLVSSDGWVPNFFGEVYVLKFSTADILYNPKYFSLCFLQANC